MKVTIAKIGKDYEVDFGALPEAMRDGVVEYGLRQILNDGHANISIKDGDSDDERATKTAEIEAAVLKRLDALRAGKYRFGGVGERIGEVEKECRAIVAAVLIAKGKGKAEAEKAAKRWRDSAKPEVVKKVEAAANAAIAARDVGGLDID